MRAARQLLLIGALVLACVLTPASVGAQSNTTYTVKAGDTLANIAYAHGISTKALMAANGIANANLVYPGQVLTIPSPAAGPAAPVPTATAEPVVVAPTVAAPAVVPTEAPAVVVTSAPAATDEPAPTPETGGSPAPASAGLAAPAAAGGIHVVQIGDTLASIARRYGVSAAAIASANGITNPDLLYVGQRLRIPGAGSTGGGTSPKPTGQVVYQVKPGDTLGRIAARYGTTAAAIARANGLASPDRISVGMRLVIPSGGSGGAGGGGGTGTATKGYRFVASISQQHCWLYKGNALVGDWTCSTGRRGSPTVPGNYRIQSKYAKAYGSAWNIWMPYWLGIYWAGRTENGIHGMPWNAKTGAKTWPGLVGTKITYGCVMLNDGPAKTLYDVAYIGMPVTITK